MRILIWSETFYPKIGGVEVMGEEFVRSLHARGHELLIIAGPYRPEVSDPQLFHGIPLYRFPFEFEENPYSVEMLVRIRKQLEEVRRFRPDVTHLYQSRRSFFFHATTKAAEHQREPTILTLHGAFFDGTPEVNEARRRFCQQVDWITACSRFTIEETRAIVPEIRPNSSFIHNALPTPNLEPTSLDFDEPRILYVGRLHPQKRVDIAIDAFALVQKRFPRARLLVAGSGREEASLRAQVQHLGLQDVVDFLGWVAPQAVPALINQATVMLVPSHLEPFGLVALQGGQMMRPVIATRVGGLPEVIVDGETGILVEDGKPEAMAEALAALLALPDYARALGVAARRHVQRHFAWNRFVDEYETLYTRLVKQARATA